MTEKSITAQEPMGLALLAAMSGFDFLADVAPDGALKFIWMPNYQDATPNGAKTVGGLSFVGARGRWARDCRQDVGSTLSGGSGQAEVIFQPLMGADLR